MPAEPTRAKLKRRSGRRDPEDYRFDGGHARELELKRNRGEISCCECRRLKIKCDKQIPCQSCQRRGCSALCPNGSLATGQGTRFVLAATAHLHEKIARLSDRIRLLEDALASIHGKHSDEPHPLLQEDLLSGNVDESREENESPEENAARTHGPDVIDAFGTLSISDHGISRFFGPTGGSESLLIANLSSSHNSPTSSHPRPTSSSQRDSLSPPNQLDKLALFTQSFPFTPLGRTEDIQEMVESHLPPYDRAVSLCETYLNQVAWIFRGVTREQLLDDMLLTIYRRPRHPDTSPDTNDPEEDYGPHDLAMLFSIFAISSLVEPEQPLTPESRHSYATNGTTDGRPSAPVQCPVLAEHFHQISQAAISLQPVLEKPSFVTIQALHLMSIYNAMSGSDLSSESSMEMTWSLITLAAHLSQTIGLHRDSERWGLSAKMVQRRRILFWDLFVADVWTSLNTGRPPSFSLAYIDCNFPRYDTKGDKSKDGGVAFEIWQFRFAAECVAEVAARTLTAEAPTYATIMELDRKVREFPLPEDFVDKNDMAASFRRCVLEHIRETILMYIHRSFFAQAIIDEPVNPLKSVYAPSFLAAYRAAATILKSVREQFNVWPNSCARFWTMWTFAFSAAVVFGTVVARGPRSPLATSAMAELDQACLLFSKAAVYSKRATKALPILMKLSEKARHALATAQRDDGSPHSGDNGLLWNVKQEDTEDELSIFAGHTRFVSAKRVPAANSVSSTVILDRPHYVDSAPLTFEQQPRERIISFDGPLPQPQRLSHRMSWASGENGSLRDQYQQHSQHSPSSPLTIAPYSYSYDRSRQETGNLGWPERNPPSYLPDGRTNASRLSSYQQNTFQHPSYNGGGYGPSQTEPPMHNPGLANLGLAARDSRLDERWSSFMQDSGLLDGVNFR
ncbi:fungal-specific transcription factor domain-containing protein [Mycena floridula]|nr:fungal-specific transcription factor domain-containing protein [Mycena floridula]